MRPRFTTATPIVVVITAVVSALVAVPPAAGQTVSLLEQLQAQYKTVKMGSDSNGPAVIEPGTVLSIQKGGILGVAYDDASTVPTKYQDGTIHTPSGLMMKGRGSLLGKFGKEQSTHLFPVGNKVYPSKIDVNLAGDKVSMTVVACDSCNKTDPTTFYKAQVVFQFAKGYLATASAGAVEDTIGQVLALGTNEDTQQDQGGGQGGQDQQGGGDQQAAGDQQGGQQQGGQQAAPQQQAPPAEPQTIQLGQTTAEVEASLGKPDKIVNLGAKQIYVYKDLKVTFLKGKVSDVQ
jgi:hypothetical protein